VTNVNHGSQIRSSPLFIILGAGTAGAHTVETLRIEGFQGRVVMITQQERMPYDSA
jgi:hypothetical protein